MSLKKEIVDYLAWVDGTNLHTLSYEERADSILSLIDRQRCVWTDIDGAKVYWQTLCGEKVYSPDYSPFCPCCGKRIEVQS